MGVLSILTWLFGDGKAIALPAVESVLKTYQANLKQKPEVKAKPIDDLLKKTSRASSMTP